MSISKPRTVEEIDQLVAYAQFRIAALTAIVNGTTRERDKSGHLHVIAELQKLVKEWEAQRSAMQED